MRRLKKSVFKGGAAGLILLLGVIRCTWPGVAGQDVVAVAADSLTVADTLGITDDTAVAEGSATTQAELPQTTPVRATGATAKQSGPVPPIGSAPVFADTLGQRISNRIKSVRSYESAFPDIQDVQIVAAREWGVAPVRDREQAERRKHELVYIGSNPYYVINGAMTESIPYLVPRAADLLQTIGRNFLDSLASKGLPAHKIYVNSVLRTDADVRRLQRKGNPNATTNSCHRYGTTFDISYREFYVVAPPGETRPQAREVSLKQVLSEVLNDLRLNGCCYVKHEVRQPCFHVTVR